jgi:cobalt-zinc-cadmium efflux system protein
VPSDHDHDHDHTGHDHGHAGHSHGVSADADQGKLAIVLGLIFAFMAFEVTVGVISHSLALLSDAAHMLTDAGAIALSLVALRLAARPAKGR